MIYTLQMYGPWSPCTVCGRAVSHVVVRDRIRFIHHADERASNCTVGNELLPVPRQEPQAAAA